MKIETIALEDQQTKLIAEFDTETLEKYKHQAARKISQSTKIPGFRPGKAPYDLVRRMVGDQSLQQEALELMMDDIYPQILKEADINPSGPGKLDEILSYDPPKFAFVVPLQPEVTLGDYKSIRKDYEPVTVTDEQVEDQLTRIQRSYATAEPVQRPAEKGDQVAVLLSAKRVQYEEGEPEMLIDNASYQMIAGEKEENEEEVWPYEGFTEQLIGVSEGDTKTIIHTFSDKSPYEDLRGQEAEFTVQVQSIKKLELPELTDEWAQTLGQFENVEALRKAIRQQLEQNNSQQYDQNYYEELINQLVDQSTVRYPPHMLEEEIEQFLHGLEHNLEHDHLDLETYLKMREIDRDTFIKQEVEPAAARRLARSLVMEQFAKAEGVEVKSDEIRSVYYAAMQQLQNSPELRNAGTKNKQSQQEMANNLAINTVNSIFNQRLMSRLKAIATGKGDEPAEDMFNLISEEAIVDDPAIVDAEATDTNVVESSPVTSAEDAATDVEQASTDAEQIAADAELSEEAPQGDQPPAQDEAEA